MDMDGKFFFLDSYKNRNIILRALFSFFYLFLCDSLPLFLILLMYSASYDEKKGKINSEENLLKGI